jgi:hypothetical protein
MNRPQKFRHIFAELKAALGDSVSSSELLECANMVLECSEGRDFRSHYVLRGGRTRFDDLPLDIVFERWEWKLMCREYHPEDDYIPQQPAEEVIYQLLEQAA